MTYCSNLRVDATLVANEFLDQYMLKANGDYVKVYLFLLRKGKDEADISEIAEALGLTEGDVRRAIRYWEETGVFKKTIAKRSTSDRPAEEELKADTDRETEKEPSKASVSGTYTPEELRSRYRRASGKDILNRLSRDAEFRQLLFVVQRYMSKVLTDSEQQVFAYLYDGLSMPCEVLDYLVDYCVQQGKSNIRYIEKVGLDWHRLGIRDVDAAKERTKSFDKARDDSRRKSVRKLDQKGQSRGTDYDSIILDKVIGRKQS